MILATIAILPSAFTAAQGSRESVINTQGTITNAPTFSGQTNLVQNDGLGNYQAINQTDGSIISSSRNAGYLINSVISDDTRVVLELGTFVLECPITSHANNVIIEGQGYGTILKVAVPDLTAFRLIGVNDWVIRDLLIDGSKNGVDASSCNYITVNGTQITNTRFDAIGVFNCQNCIVSNNIIFNCSEGFAIHVWNTTDSKILNNKADFTYWSVIAVSDGSNNNLVQGNIASRGGQNGTLGDGIEIGSHQNQEEPLAMSWSIIPALKMLLTAFLLLKATILSSQIMRSSIIITKAFQ
jgi:parallel beta-helix repeat protein